MYVTKPKMMDIKKLHDHSHDVEWENRWYMLSQITQSNWAIETTL